MLEKDIERKLIAGVKRAGGKAYKFVSPGNVGVPDRIVIWPNGVIHFVELKTSKGVICVKRCRCGGWLSGSIH